MRSSSLAAALGASLALLSLPLPARANGRFPAAQALVPAPGDPSLFVLRTTFGLVISRDQGTSWDWVCEGAIGYDPNEDPSLGVTQSGAILAGAFKGLYASTDTACTWGKAAGGIQDPVADIVVSKANPHAALVLTSGYLGQDDAGATFTSKVLSTADDGAHWAQVGPSLDPEVLPETIEIAPSDPSRVYVSGTRKVGGVATGVFLASADSGATWTATNFPLVPQVESAPFIAAVDPGDAKRVYVRVKGTKGTRLAFTADGGATFRDVWQSQGDMLGFALSADGSRVYAGGTVDGLNVAARGDLDAHQDGGPSPFVQTSKAQIQCLAMAGATLWACSNDASGFIVGTTADEGKTFTPKLHLCGVRGPLACPASSPVTTTCGPLWSGDGGQGGQADALAAPCGGGDAGASSSGGGGGSGASSGGGGGCSLTSPASAGATSIALAALAAAVLAVRRRRPRA